MQNINYVEIELYTNEKEHNTVTIFGDKWQYIYQSSLVNTSNPIALSMTVIKNKNAVDNWM